MRLGGQRVLGGGRAPRRECFLGAPAPCRFLPHSGDNRYLGRGKAPKHRAAVPRGTANSTRLELCPAAELRPVSTCPPGGEKCSHLSQYEWLKLAAYCTASQWVPASLPSLLPTLTSTCSHSQVDTSPGAGGRWLSCSQHPGEGQAGEPRAGKQHLPVS